MMTADANTRNEPTMTAANFYKTVPFLPLSYDSHNSETSARTLVRAIEPSWVSPDGLSLAPGVQIVRCTDGITNTLLKIINKPPGTTRDDADKHAFLLRAYGNGTHVLIDREREAENHELLMRHGLAPELLARFQNGMLYRYIRGTVTHPEDLRRPDIFMAVAKRLAQWHATVPCIVAKSKGRNAGDEEAERKMNLAASGKPIPNMWTVMQKWILALPTKTEMQKAKQEEMQKEFDWLRTALGDRPSLGENGLVFAHCDLLHGNIIVEPEDVTAARNTTDKLTVTFIDYEYATPSPVAFDICNHFAEWGGFSCDYSVMPTRSQRLSFIRSYISAYFAGKNVKLSAEEAEEKSRKLATEVDIFRGVPGFYWGVWSQIQAMISEIDFDYASYAETRMGEYWAWKKEFTGERGADEELGVREARWAEE